VVTSIESFSLNELINKLQASGDLIIIDDKVKAKYELAGTAKQYEGKKPVLFNNVEGYQYPVLIGLYWNRKVIASIFSRSEEDLPDFIADTVSRWRSKESVIKPIILDKGPANEIIELNPDLNLIPVPTHFLNDGGPYFLSSAVIAKDPETGIRNTSINRVMVTGPRSATMLMDEGRHLRDYYERAEKQGKPLEITINNGVEPSVYFTSLVPSALCPINRDELEIASELRGKPIELLQSQTVDVEGIANAQFIIEGEILPEVREPEGPCAEVTGYYANRADRWVVKVKAITHRIDSIFHTLLPGKEVYNSVGLVGETNVCRLVSSQVPGVKAIHFPHGGCGFYKAVIQLKKKAEGEAKNAIMATFAAFPSLRIAVVVDDDVDIYNPEDVDWAISTRFDPIKGMLLVENALGHELNPMTRNGVGSKIGMDATQPLGNLEEFKRVKTQEV